VATSYNESDKSLVYPISWDLRVEWAHDRHPLAEYVYDVVYMRHWRDVDLARDIADLQ